jgi:hypothetical protein
MDGSFFKDVKSIHRKISSKWEVYSHKYKERNSLEIVEKIGGRGVVSFSCFVEPDKIDSVYNSFKTIDDVKQYIRSNKLTVSYWM